MIKKNIAIVGATGAVGRTLLCLLEERGFPVNELYLLASERSAGQQLPFRHHQIQVRPLDSFDFSKVDICFFSAGGAISKIYAPKAVAAGCVVIDNTSEFRYQKNIPLIVPEVNGHLLKKNHGAGIISNPNCSTIQMVVALKPLYDAVGIERINVATYQSVSGTGQKAMDELRLQSQQFLSQNKLQSLIYPKPIAFNVLPHIDSFQENGYTREEMKMVWETQKILEDENIRVNPTTVRVPVFYGHSEAVHIETRDKLSVSRAKELLSQAPGIVLMDREDMSSYPTPLFEGEGKDAVYVGRIREDISHPRGLNLWVVADNLRKGAALNAIQIAEVLIKQ